MFITFEGGEGAGKTTLIIQIAKTLSSKGKSVLVTREPGGTELGEAIREMLLHHKSPISPYAELSLFLASRAQHVSNVIRPALASGKIVLCDRFNDSSIAYQGLARGLGMKETASFCHFISQIEPDLTLYLDLDPEEGLRRAKKTRPQDRIEAEEVSFHKKIREGYLLIHQAHPERVHLLDASQDPQTVFTQAISLIHSFFSLQDSTSPTIS